MYTPVNPSFTIYKWGLSGSKLYRYVFVMYFRSVHVIYEGKLGHRTDKTGCQKRTDKTGYQKMTRHRHCQILYIAKTDYKRHNITLELKHNFLINLNRITHSP